MILDSIVEKKKLQLVEEKKLMSLNDMRDKLDEYRNLNCVSFYDSIKNYPGVSIIAEIKKASPSKGIIKSDFDPMLIAREYVEANVQAISILTEKNFFQGNDLYITEVKGKYKVSVLRKDFFIDEWQIYQAKLIGADAILLIASILDKNQIEKFIEIARELNMDCLVEVHDREELEKVLVTNARIIGINNRDLKTFNLDLATTKELAKYIPADKIIVSESGIKSKEDILYLRNFGVKAVLIGETLMRADSILSIINEMRVE